MVIELFIEGKKLNIFLVLIRQSYFDAPKSIRLSCSHYFIMKIFNKWERQQIAFNHLLHINFEDFKNLSKKCTAKPNCF